MNLKIYKYLPLLIAVFVSLFLYGSFGYQLERENTINLLGLYVGLFFLYLYFLNCGCSNFTLLLVAGILFRLIFLLATPNLSQDFYRFIWDGHLISEGINPYIYSPNELVASGILKMSNWEVLYQGMGALSADNHSNYPPLNQFFFYVSDLFGGKTILSSVITLRVIIILAELGVVFFGIKLLKSFNLSRELIFLYFLNPLVIIELTGNLHFEGVMLFFIIVSIWVLQKGHWQWAAILLAASISVKLIPLMFLQLFFKYFKNDSNASKGIWHFINFCLLTLLFFMVSFLPFLNQDLINFYFDTVGLWFNKFEFNASIYYVLREIGYSISGYNQIAVIGKLLAVITFLFIISLALFKRNKTIQDLMLSMVLVLSVYFFLSTTVHPWYLITLIGLSIFTPLRFAIVWSLMIILSYMAYANPEFNENPWILGIEYTVVFGYLFFELRKNRKEIKWIMPW